MKITIIINILIIYIYLNNFISFINCQCYNGFYISNYGCNSNINFNGIYSTNCYGEGAYFGSVLVKIDENATPICPLAGNPPSAVYSPFGNSSINEIINNQIIYTQCYSNDKNLNVYYIGGKCLSNNDQFIKNITINLNGYLYVGTCSNYLSVFKSYTDSNDFANISSTECSNVYSGTYEISHNTIFYGNVQCPNCNNQGQCSSLTNYNCQCNQQYSFDQFCRYNYCTQPVYPCGESKCNSETMECYCDQGYSLNKITNQCIDINECIIGNGNSYPCLKNYICQNNDGSYECECPYNSTLNNSNQLCQLKCPNNCGDPSKGTCINGICKCNIGYGGPDCLDINLTNNTKPNINSTSPSVIFKPNNETYQSLIFIKEIIEVDIYNTIINQYSLDTIKWNYENITNSTSLEIYSYNTTINNNGFETTIKVLLQWFKNQSNILEFANQEISINPYSLKFNIEISKYNFKNQLCSLQLIINTAMLDNQATCTSYSVDQTNLDSDYFTLNIDNNSFKCRLLKRGIIDNQVRKLSNSFKYLTNENNSTFNSLSIITNLPYYSNSIQLDPDFSIILKGNNQNIQNQICNNKNNGLSNNQIIGIVIGSCIGFIILILILIIMIKKLYIFRATKVGIKLNKLF